MKTYCEIAKEHFPGAIRKRGQKYWDDGRVALLSETEEEVDATVIGSDQYDVSLSLIADEHPPVVSGWCSCPYFETEFMCKHLWAVMVALDKKHGPSLPDDAVYEDESDLDFGFGSAIPFPEEKQAAAKKKEPREWERLLQRVDRERMFNPVNEKTPVAAEVPGERELRYEIRMAYPPVHVTPVMRQRKKTGEWGQWKDLSPTTTKLPGLDHENLLLITALHGLMLRAASSYYSSSYRFSDITREQAVCLLPRLCATEKLFVVKGSGDLDGPLRWDGDVPWRYQLRYEQKKNGDYAAVSWLLRGGEQMRPTDLAAVFEDLLFTQDNRICLLQCEHETDRLWLMQALNHGDVSIPKEDGAAFLTELFKRTHAPTICLAADMDTVRRCGEPEKWLAIHAPAADKARVLDAEVYFKYGETRVPAFLVSPVFGDGDGKTLYLRASELEGAAVARLMELGAVRSRAQQSDDSLISIPADRIREIPAALMEEGWKVTMENRRCRSAGSFSMNVTSGMDWFDLQGACEYGDQRATLPELLEAARHRKQWVELSDGSCGFLPEEWLKKWSAIAELGAVQKDGVRFSKAQGALLDIWLAEQDDVKLDPPFLAMRKELARFRAIKPCREPDGFRGELRAYQRDGLGWLLFLERFGLGGCLADDMGLGKTVQVLALLEILRERRAKDKTPPSLVVVPRSLIFNWLREGEQFAPSLRFMDHTGSARTLDEGWETKCDVLITTYGTLRRDIGLLKEIEFNCVILDESQAIKNEAAQITKATRLLRARRRLAMSGTPIENHLGELWSLMEFLNPGLLGRSSGFQKAMTDNPDLTQREWLARALRPFILRRTKGQVAKDLPDRQEDTLYCELAPAQRKQYDEIRDHYRRSLLGAVDKKGLNKTKIQVLEALLRLRQAACHPALIDTKYQAKDCAKFEALLPRLQELIEEGHKVLVFSQFTGLLALLRGELDTLGLRYEYLDGKTRDRQARVDRFQNTPELPLFLISLKAGGLGLNLTAADYVFLLDPWWNPAVEAQAIDRAHRIGQVRRVLAYRLIAKDTVEEKVLMLQQQKKELADAILNEDNALIRRMTREDLELLLS